MDSCSSAQPSENPGRAPKFEEQEHPKVIETAIAQKPPCGHRQSHEFAKGTDKNIQIKRNPGQRTDMITGILFINHYHTSI